MRHINAFLLVFALSLSFMGNSYGAKCFKDWKLVNCENIFGNKTYKYCIVDKLNNGLIRCTDCKSGLGGVAGQTDCKGWTIGYDFSQNKPSGSVGESDDDIALRTVDYGECNENNSCSGELVKPSYDSGDTSLHNTKNSWISHVDVTLGDSKDVACNHPNLKKIPGDLNSGTGGKFIYLCKEYSNNSQKLVDLKITIADDEKNYCPNGYKRDGVDLNSSVKGKYIYFCRKYSASEAPIKEIKFSINADSSVAKSQCGNGWTLRSEDLNAEAGGDFVYLCFKK